MCVILGKGGGSPHATVRSTHKKYTFEKEKRKNNHIKYEKRDRTEKKSI